MSRRKKGLKVGVASNNMTHHRNWRVVMVVVGSLGRRKPVAAMVVVVMVMAAGVTGLADMGCHMMNTLCIRSGTLLLLSSSSSSSSH